MDYAYTWRIGSSFELEIQITDEGFDYTITDAYGRDVDGGQIDNLEMTLLEALDDIRKAFNLEDQPVTPVSDSAKKLYAA